MTILPAILTGLSLGFTGSFHCVGMCGPLALSLPVYHLQGVKKIVAPFLYNAGRVCTYSALGFLLGLAGKGFASAGWQQLFSIIVGSITLLLTLFYFIWNKRLQPKWLQRFNFTVQKSIAHFLHQSNNGSYFLLGTVNGLLPCGMVYMAIAAALVTGNIVQGTLLMACFGIATMPAMLLLGVAGTGISMPVRAMIKKLTPVFMIAVSCLLILRGMNLGIPFISPQITTQAKEVIRCH
jgi:uncharacterized protein